MPYSLASSGLLILTKAIPCYQNKVMERLDNKDEKASVDTLAELENIDDECDSKVQIIGII